MFPLVSSVLLVLCGSEAIPTDSFDDLSHWTPAGLEIAPEGGKTGLVEGRAVGRAENVQQADADSTQKCSMKVKVKLGRKEKLHRRACLRMTRGTKTAFARVTVWWSPSEKRERLRLECGVVGDATPSPPVVIDWPETGAGELWLELEAQDSQLTGKFGSDSCTHDAGDFSVGADSTRFLIEAGGNREIVRLDDFSAQWKAPP